MGIVLEVWGMLKFQMCLGHVLCIFMSGCGGGAGGGVSYQ